MECYVRHLITAVIKYPHRCSTRQDCSMQNNWMPSNGETSGNNQCPRGAITKDVVISTEDVPYDVSSCLRVTSVFQTCLAKIIMIYIGNIGKAHFIQAITAVISHEKAYLKMKFKLTRIRLRST